MSAIGLPHYWRVQIWNDLGYNITGTSRCTVMGRLVKFDSAGALTFSSETTIQDHGATDITDQDGYETTEIDNSTNKYLGAELELKSDSNDGTPGAGDYVRFYLQGSTDGGTTWPDDEEGILIGVHDHSGGAGVITTVVEV